MEKLREELLILKGKLLILKGELLIPKEKVVLPSEARLNILLRNQKFARENQKSTQNFSIEVKNDFTR